MPRAIALLITILVSTACGGSLPDGHETHALDGPSQSIESSASPRELVPRLVASQLLDAEALHIGQLDHVLLRDTMLIGVDVRECAVVVVSRRARRQGRRFGRCGGGPGELREISGVAIQREQVVVLDNDGRRIQRFALDGAHIDALSTKNLMRAGGGIWQVSTLDDDHLLVVVDYTPLQYASRLSAGGPNAYLRVLDVRTGEVVDSALVPGEAIVARNNNESTNVSTCVDAREASGALRIATANLQYPELIAMAWDTARRRLRFEGPRWLVPELLTKAWASSEEPAPMPDLVRLACMSTGVLLLQVRFNPDLDAEASGSRQVRPMLWRDARIEVGPWESEGLWSSFGRLFSAAGDSLLFIKHDSLHGPEIRTVVLARD
jgi:hypothetical protein